MLALDDFQLQGSKADLLIDTGVGIHEVEFEKEDHSFVMFFIHQLSHFLTSTGLRRPGSEKPLSVLITHMHFDHSGGAHQFKEESENLANSITVTGDGMED